MSTKHELLELIDDVKQKLTDQEYKLIVETLQKLSEGVSKKEHEDMVALKRKYFKLYCQARNNYDNEKKLVRMLMARELKTNVNETGSDSETE